MADGRSMPGHGSRIRIRIRIATLVNVPWSRYALSQCF